MERTTQISSSIYYKNVDIVRKAVAMLSQSLVEVVKFPKKFYKAAIDKSKELKKGFIRFAHEDDHEIAMFRDKESAEVFNKHMLSLDAVEIDFTPMTEDELKLLCKGLRVDLLSWRQGQGCVRVCVGSVPKALLFSKNLVNHPDGRYWGFEWVLRKNCTKCSAAGHESFRCPLNQTEIGALKRSIAERRLHIKNYNDIHVAKKPLKSVHVLKKPLNSVHEKKVTTSTHVENRRWTKKFVEKETNVVLSSQSESTATQESPVIQGSPVTQESTNDDSMEEKDGKKEIQTASLPEKPKGPGGSITFKHTFTAPKDVAKPVAIPLRLKKKDETYVAEYIDAIAKSGSDYYYHIKFVGHTSNEEDGQFYPKSHFPDLETLTKLIANGIKLKVISRDMIHDKKVAEQLRTCMSSDDQ